MTETILSIALVVAVIAAVALLASAGFAQAIASPPAPPVVKPVRGPRPLPVASKGWAVRLCDVNGIVRSELHRNGADAPGDEVLYANTLYKFTGETDGDVRIYHEVRA